MRIATWNVNSLKARQDKVLGWLERAAPDILLIQETKLSDDDAPVMAFAMQGYDFVHHGEGRWNGVAIAARQELGVADIVTNFGDGPVRDSGPGAAVAVGEEDFDPSDEARMVSAVIDPAGPLAARSGSSACTPPTAESSAPLSSPASSAGTSAWSAGCGRRAGQMTRWSSAATSTSPRPTRTSGIPPQSTAAPTSPSPNVRRSGHSWTGAWSMPTGSSVPSPDASHGGITAPAISTRTSGCGSTTCCSAGPSRSASSGRRSIARRARGHRSLPTTPRWSSTWTHRAANSMPTGMGLCRASPPGRGRRGGD